MKSLLRVVFLAAAATTAVVSNEVLDMVERTDVADVAVNEIKEDVVVVTDVDEVTDETEPPEDADVPEETVLTIRRNLNLGSIASGDELVYNNEVMANGIEDRFHLRDITIPAPMNWRVSVIRVNRVGPVQNAIPSILRGGLGSSYVTIRIRSATGCGYHYRIQVYVR